MKYRGQALFWVLVIAAAVYTMYAARFVAVAGFAAASEPAVSAPLYLAEGVGSPENIRLLLALPATVGLPAALDIFIIRAIGLPDWLSVATAYVWGLAIYLGAAAGVYTLASRLVSVQVALAASLLYVANGKVAGDALALSPALAAGALAVWAAFLLTRDVDRGSVSWTSVVVTAAATLFGPIYFVVPAAGFWIRGVGIAKTARLTIAVAVGVVYGVLRFACGGVDGIWATVNPGVTDPLLTTGERVVGVWYAFFNNSLNLLQGYYAGVFLATTLLMVLPLFIFGVTWLYRGRPPERFVASFALTVIFGALAAGAAGGTGAGIVTPVAAAYPLFVVAVTVGLVLLGYRRVLTFKWLGKILAPAIYIMMVVLGLMAHWNLFYRRTLDAERAAELDRWAPEAAEIVAGAAGALTFGDYEVARILPVPVLDVAAPSDLFARAGRWGIPVLLAEAGEYGEVVAVCPPVVADRYPDALVNLSSGNSLSIYRVVTTNNNSVVSTGSEGRINPEYEVSFFEPEDNGFVYTMIGKGRSPGYENPYFGDVRRGLKNEATVSGYVQERETLGAGFNSGVYRTFEERLDLPPDIDGESGPWYLAGYFRSVEGTTLEISSAGRSLGSFKVNAGDDVRVISAELPDYVLRSDVPITVRSTDGGAYESFGYVIYPFKRLCAK
ncbi:MAG: hypothetical protein JSW52_03015 [Candidatus Coatesbacteria bacterium]|nr:MAG: hypothetical protein JSW52_03015 [Candidatus Coatesbacteria bacterium]